MKFVQNSSGCVFDESMLRSAHPNTSWPSPLTHGDVADLGYSQLVDTPQPDHNQDTHVAIEAVPALVEGIWTQQWSIQDRPAAEVVAIAAAKAKAAEQAQKMAGVLFGGVMCSATKDDQAGLLAVWMDYMSSPNEFQPTRFDFANGNTLVLTEENLPAFRSVWGAFRRQFFNP